MTQHPKPALKQYHLCRDLDKDKRYNNFFESIWAIAAQATQSFGKGTNPHYASCIISRVTNMGMDSSKTESYFVTAEIQGAVS